MNPIFKTRIRHNYSNSIDSIAQTILEALLILHFKGNKIIFKSVQWLPFLYYLAT